MDWGMVGEAEVNVDCDFSRRRCLKCGGALQGADVWWSNEAEHGKVMLNCGVAECGFSWGFLGDEMRYLAEERDDAGGMDLEAMDAVPEGALGVFGEVPRARDMGPGLV